MAKKSRIRDKDYNYAGFAEAVDQVAGRGKQHFYFGIFEETPEEVMKAAVHEFGSKLANVPARKWLSRFFDSKYKWKLKELYVNAIEAVLLTGKDKEEVFREASDEAILLLWEFLETDPLSPGLTKEWLTRKVGPFQMFNEGDMTLAFAIKYHDRGGVRTAKTLAGGKKNTGGKNARLRTRPRPSGNKGGRPRGSSFMRHAATFFRAISGPTLYEGYGFRKGPEAKPRHSTTQRLPQGGKRTPTRDPGRPMGRYPSVSRPK